MSERIDDPNFEDYSWTDHEREVHYNNQGITQQQKSTSDVDPANGGSTRTDESATLSPALLDQFDRNQNSEWYGQQNTTPHEGASPNHSQGHENDFKSSDYKTHPDYSKSLEKVKQDQRFILDGNEYFRHNGATYRQQNTIPNIGKLLSPEEVEKIDGERARRHMDPPIQGAEGPGEALAAGVTSGGLSWLRGVPIATSVGKAALSFVKESATGLIKNTMKQ